MYCATLRQKERGYGVMTSYLDNGLDFSRVDPQTRATLVYKHMTARLAFTFLANRAIRDQSSSKFSFIDVFDSFTIPASLPSTTEFFTVGGRILNIEAGTANVEVSIIPEGSDMPIENGVITLEGPVKAGSLIIAAQFGFVKFDRPLRYNIRVKYNDTLLEGDSTVNGFSVFKGSQ